MRLHICRRIRQGWTAPEEWLEIAINHHTRRLSVRVIFPKARPPRHAFLIEESTGAARELKQRRWQADRQGRTVLIWQKRQPQLGETYLLRWEW